MENVIKALRELQKIDSRLDEIYEMRGNIPEKIVEIEKEKKELEDKMNSFKNRFKDLELELKMLGKKLEENELALEKDEKLFTRVKNNKEYDALTAQIEARKERTIELRLETEEVSEKKEKVKMRLDAYKEHFEEVSNKKEELDLDLAERVKKTDKEEKKLRKSRKNIEKEIIPQYRRLYTTIRKNKKLVVAEVDRNSCSGCNSIIPLQRQAEIKNQRKIILCETCGRINFSREEDKAKVDSNNAS